MEQAQGEAPEVTLVSPGCGTCSPAGAAAKASPSYVYALGRIQARFPSLAVEREFAQLAGHSKVEGLTDRETVYSVLSQQANRYLARQMCWVFTVEGLESYVLLPRDPGDFDLLVDTVRPAPRATDVDIAIGTRGPMAPPELSGGLTVPLVMFDQIYSFDVDSLINSIPRTERISAERFGVVAEELFSRIRQLADNTGASDENRALNYLAVRYPAIYAHAAESFGRNRSLTEVTARPSRLSGVRNIVDVIFSFTHRETDVTEKHFVRVDVAEKFPFLITKLSPYYEH
jgi:PatG C-terminal